MKTYIFVLSPPYSGSTVLWRLLATSPHVSTFQKEGQYLDNVKKLLREKPWNPDKKIPWGEIKAAWEDEWDMTKPILLEKSPPHLMQAFEIEAAFVQSYFIIINRNPYAFCEGYCRREKKSMAEAARFWLKCANYQKKNIEGLDKTLYFSYEALAENPLGMSNKILNFLPELQQLDPSQHFAAQSIINYGAKPIQNFNQIKINQLSAKEILSINAVLSENLDCMRFFGYELMQPNKLHDMNRYKTFIFLKVSRFLARTHRVAKRILKSIVLLPHLLSGDSSFDKSL